MSKGNRTCNELLDSLDKALGWRKRELTVIKNQIPSSENPAQDAMIRAAVAILYAHWEGFVKEVATSYLQFVSLKRLKYGELKSAFVVLSVKEKLQVLDGTRIEKQKEIVDFLRNKDEEQANIPYKNSIKTKANLKFDVFRDIYGLLELDYNQYSVLERFINQLVEDRNSIAHGEWCSIRYSEYVERFNKIIKFMEDIKTDIMNAATLGDYKIQQIV